MMPLLLTVKRYRKFVERFIEYSMAKGKPVFMRSCQMKLLKTWRPLNFDYIAWLTTVVEVI